MKEFKNKTTEIFHQIPKEIRKTYSIRNRYGKNEECIEVHFPSYVNIDLDFALRVENRKHVIAIINDKVAVTLWKRVEELHVTVF